MICKPLQDLRKLITLNSSQPLISHNPPTRTKLLSNLVPDGSDASKVLDANRNHCPYRKLQWLKKLGVSDINHQVIIMGRKKMER